MGDGGLEPKPLDNEIETKHLYRRCFRMQFLLEPKILSITRLKRHVVLPLPVGMGLLKRQASRLRDGN